MATQTCGKESKMRRRSGTLKRLYIMQELANRVSAKWGFMSDARNRYIQSQIDILISRGAR